MSLGPILPGRLPTSLIASRLQRNLQHGSKVLTQLQEQVATGQKYLLPSESPASAVRTMALQSALERQAQMQANVVTNRSLLAATESALGPVSDAFNRAIAFAASAVGDSSTSAEKQALAVETSSLIQQVMNAANTKFRGRYLFGGSQSQQTPFEFASDGTVRYNGDVQSLDAQIDLGFLISNNIDGKSAFGAMTKPVGGDVDPALRLETKIRSLHAGEGVALGAVQVTLDDGGGNVRTELVDLSAADTIRDVKTVLENAFADGPVTLAVDIDPTTNFGLRLTPSAGTITVADLPGNFTAANLGIRAEGVAEISGKDLDPRLTLQTPLAALNGGDGIGATAGNGLFITNGEKSAVIDLSGAETIEDLVHRLDAARLDLDVRINDAGNGLAISSRLSGAPFSIGEHNGENATRLGIRTLVAQTRLQDLNSGQGVPVDSGDSLEIVRRDGSTVSVDVAGLQTVQQVLDAINAVDPGNLVASLKSVGNGISISDNSGTGTLIVEENGVSTALGLAGEQSDPDPNVPLEGRDVHPLRAEGILSLLVALESALRNEDDAELERISQLLEKESVRFGLVRSELGSRLKLIDDVESRLLDEHVSLNQSLSEEFDADLTEVITQLTAHQLTLQATMQIAAQSMHLSLLHYL